MNTQNPTVLLIEDDPQMRLFLKTQLQRRDWQVIESACAKTGLSFAKETPLDLIILDLGLPDMDGIHLIQRLRQFSQLPILVLSARNLEQSKILALDTGADDYLTKPFGIGELNARVQALLRRIHKTTPTDFFKVDALLVDLTKRKVFIGEQEIKLTPIEYRLLTILIEHAGLVVTHRHLLKIIWGAAHLRDNHYLRIYMRQLRHKIEVNPARPRYLLTETGVGYRLVDN